MLLGQIPGSKAIMPISIQPLSDNDLGAAAMILGAAFRRSDTWITDLHFNRNLQPDGYFGAFLNGILVGMVGSTIYSTYAFVGLMAVHPEHQHQGVGRALMSHLLAWLEQQKVQQVILDASNAGQPLYEKLGFTAFDEVLVLHRSREIPPFPQPPVVNAITKRELPLLIEDDTEAFGADRSQVLSAVLLTYPDRGFWLQDNHNRPSGYLFVQRNRIGPWVMQRSEDAEALLRAALCFSFPEDVSVVVPESNRKAVDLLQRYEFKIVRVNRHMGRGIAIAPEQNSKIYGKASLALG
jgi:ribosomal protein S18 acetylase RimI-like enzyme